VDVTTAETQVGYRRIQNYIQTFKPHLSVTEIKYPKTSDIERTYFDRRDGHVDVDFFQSQFTERVDDKPDVAEVVDRSTETLADVVNEAERLVHQVAILGVAVSSVAHPPCMRLRPQGLFQRIFSTHITHV